MIEKIGINAGKVWAQLDENGKMDVKALKKAVKLNDKDLFAAFGWLAREEKIELVLKDKEIYVSLC